MDYDRPDTAETTRGNGCGPSPAPPYGGTAPGLNKAEDGQRLRMTLGNQGNQNEARSVPLRERVYAAMQCSQRELEYNQRRYQHAHRCAQLMELHPEVAELVELLREF